MCQNQPIKIGTHESKYEHCDWNPTQTANSLINKMNIFITYDDIINIFYKFDSSDNIILERIFQYDKMKKYN